MINQHTIDINPITSYRTVKISKSKNLYRTVYIVSTDAKNRLRELLPVIEEIYCKIEAKNVSYAFQKEKNVAQAAFNHIGYKHTLSFDIEDFFNSVKESHLKNIVPDWIIQSCFINNAPQQGLPTSPLLANIAFSKCDHSIINACEKLKIDTCYTRYADDLIFSFDDIKIAGKLKVVVSQILAANGFKINSKKTKLQSSSNGRIIIHGIAVDKHGLHPTRKTKRKMRAALHQKNIFSYSGLEEWSKCKLGSFL